MNQPLTGFRYAQTFQCSGADCPETCCYGWRINVPREEYDHLHGHYGDTFNGATCFDVSQFPEDTPQELKDVGFAFLRMKPDGFCPFLEQGWCAIHRDLGEASLPGVCATYPRYLVEGAGGDFLSGSLSCPEMARLCLLQEDAMAHVKLERDILPPGFEISSSEPGQEDWYKYFFSAVNGFIKWLLAQKELRTADFALLVLDLATEIQPFYHAGITENPAAKLDHVVGVHANPERIVPRVTAFRTRSDMHGDGLAFVAGLLQLSTKQSRSPRFRTIAGEILAGLPNLEIYQFGRDAFVPVNLSHLEGLLNDRRARVLARFGDQLETYLYRFTLNFWTQKLFSNDVSLLRLWLRYALFLNTLRFTCFHHPRFEALLAVEDEAAAREGFGTAVVDMLQGLMRAYDHDVPLVAKILDQMVIHGLDRHAALESWLVY